MVTAVAVAKGCCYRAACASTTKVKVVAVAAAANLETAIH